MQNQIIKMEVDAVRDEGAYGPGGNPPPEALATHEWPAKDTEEWVASLGYGLTQGAVGKSGKGKDKDEKGKGKGYGKGSDWKGGGDKGKGLGAERARDQWELALTVGGSGITTGRARYA